MNQSKIKYLRGRVEEIYKERANSVTAEYRKKALTNDEKFELLKAGKFSIRSQPVNPYDRSLETFIEFEGIEEPNLEERDTRLKELSATKTKLLDEIIMGDETEALALLRGFENG